MPGALMSLHFPVAVAVAVAALVAALLAGIVLFPVVRQAERARA